MNNCDWGDEFSSCLDRCDNTFNLLPGHKYSTQCMEACRNNLPDNLQCGGLPSPCNYGVAEESYSQCIFSCGAGTSNIDDCISQCRSSLNSRAINTYNNCLNKPYN